MANHNQLEIKMHNEILQLMIIRKSWLPVQLCCVVFGVHMPSSPQTDVCKFSGSNPSLQLKMIPLPANVVKLSESGDNVTPREKTGAKQSTDNYGKYIYTLSK